MRATERVLADTNVFLSGLLGQSSVPGQAAPRARHPGVLRIYRESSCEAYAKRNSFVRNSLIMSRSFAAFSNSNRLAASRMSDSSFTM